MGSSRTIEKAAKVLDLIKIENTIFVLPFVYIGMLFANGATPVKFALITLALVTARGAAFAANRYIGRAYDLKNPKKAGWSSVSLYSKKEIILIFLAFAAIFLACAYWLNLFAFVFAPLVLVLVTLEPYAKKYTEHRHFTMGLVIGLGILGGYIGVAGAFPSSPALYVLLAGYALFSGANDIIISAIHREFDAKNGLKTYSTKYGVESAFRYSYYAHGLAVLAFALFGFIAKSWVIIAAALVAYIIFLLEHRAASRSLAERNILGAFFYYNAAVSLTMLASVIIFKFVCRC